jgi:hypothetical protein
MGKEGSHDRRDSSKGTHPALRSAMRTLERMIENALRRTFWGVAAAMIALSGCGAGAQKSIVQTAISSGAERSTAFEATARALDEHPEYVDEFYEVARRHPPMLNRFLSDTARDLHDPKLARPTAALLAQHPQSLETTLVDTLDAARGRPGARAAIDRAVVERHVVLADVLSDDGSAVFESMNAVVAEASRKPQARAALLDSMRASAIPIADILKSDPSTMKVLMGAMLRETDHPDAEEVLRKLDLAK